MKYTIGDLAEIIDGDRGKNYPQQHEFSDEGYCLFLNTGNVTKEGFSFNSNQYITKAKSDLLRKGKLQRRDIVYTTRGTVGNAAFYSDDIPYEHIRINSGMIIIRPKEELVCTEFLYQILKSEYYRPYFRRYCTGSAQPQLPIKNFITIELDIPDLQSQRHIADILSTYDALIENNQKQIKLLEEAAQRLCKEWFVDLRFPGHENVKIVDGVPEGWKRSTLGEIASILRRGISPKYDDGGKYLVISQKCIRRSIMDTGEARRESKEYAPELNLQDADTVICSTGTGTLGRVGQVCGTYPDTTFDSHVTLVRTENYQNFFYQAIKSQQEFLMGMGRGSTNQQELYRDVIESLQILMPTQEILNKAEKMLSSIHHKVTALNSQILLLIEVRDRLLPKLMSGELEV